MNKETDSLPIATRLAIDTLAQSLAIKALIGTHPNPAHVRATVQALLPGAEALVADGGFLADVAPEQMRQMLDSLRRSVRALLQESQP